MGLTTRLGRDLTIITQLVLIAVVTPWLTSAADYQPPDVDSEIFNVDNIELSPAERDALANELAAVVRRGNTNDQDHLDFSTRALGVALRLAPANKLAVVANSQLSNGQPPRAVKSTYSTPDATATFLLKTALALKQAGGHDNTVLCGLLLSLANDIAPAHDDAVYEFEMFTRKQAVNWAAISKTSPTKATPDTPTETPKDTVSTPKNDIVPITPVQYVENGKELVRRQASIHGLFVLTTGSGMKAGQAMDVIVTVFPYPSPSTVNYGFARPVGEEMATSMREALRAVRVRYPNIEGGIDMKMSFGDKYSPKDGGSAGTAFALLMLSLLDGLSLDPDLAVTGDITVDWKTRAVGAIAPKVRGAHLDACSLVAVPSANEPQIAEMGLLYSPKIFHDIQIFGIENLQEAAALARTDRDSDLQTAIDLFAKIQRYLKKKPHAHRRDRKLQNALRKIVKSAPNHWSAKYLLLDAKTSSRNG